MGTMNVSLPDPLRGFVDDQVRKGGYGSSSEYIRALIRRDQERQQLRNLLLEGGQSAALHAADTDYFDQLRQTIGA